MCKFCEDNYNIVTTFGKEYMSIRMDEENNFIMKLRTVQDGINLTKPIYINYCPFCGKELL